MLCSPLNFRARVCFEIPQQIRIQDSCHVEPPPPPEPIQSAFSVMLTLTLPVVGCLGLPTDLHRCCAILALQIAAAWPGSLQNKLLAHIGCPFKVVRSRAQPLKLRAWCLGFSLRLRDTMKKQYAFQDQPCNRNSACANDGNFCTSCSSPMAPL